MSYLACLAQVYTNLVHVLHNFWFVFVRRSPRRPPRIPLDNTTAVVGCGHLHLHHPHHPPHPPPSQPHPPSLASTTYQPPSHTPTPSPVPPPLQNRFCPYFTSAIVPVPAATAPSTSSKPSSLPLSPVTPMRPARRGSTGNGNGGAGGGSVPASPLHQHALAKQSPGAAATARAISDELAGGRGMSTPSRPAREGKAGRGGGAGAGAGGKNGGANDGGMLSFVCFSMGGKRGIGGG